MTALEEIKKAEHERIWLEPAGAPDRCWCQDNQWGDEGVEYVLASTLESLQRENETLRQDRDHIAAEKAGIAKNSHNNVDYWKSQAEAAEAEVKRLKAEIDRKSSMPGDHRYWEGRYREEAEDNELMRSVLRPMAEVAGDVSESWPDDAQVVTEIGHFRRARAALASTGGEHHAE
ncbi:hypothetical protein [Agrobacterium pusense]|uniref:hypothetical protein n=1 Tax=Agrobacterium pusense TaxID=648995 RepID=UPI000513A799|nr:hypothetical protein [Agrobacterium pusense]KGE79673.1 hypothetical protein LW14_27920 [Rhizobium sp. H41]QWW74689.1 hypothetical protein KP800_04185 [Agrobacterium pusense]